MINFSPFSRTLLPLLIISLFAGCMRKQSTFKLPVVLESQSPARSANSHVDIWGRPLKVQETEEVFAQAEVTVSPEGADAQEKVTPWIFAIANRTDAAVDVELSALENEIVSAHQIKKSLSRPYRPWNSTMASLFGASIIGHFVLLPLSFYITASGAVLILPAMGLVGLQCFLIGNALAWETVFPIALSRQAYKTEFDYQMQFSQFIDAAVFPHHYALAPREEMRRIVFTREQSEMPLTFVTTGADGNIETCIVDLRIPSENGAFISQY